MKKKFTYAQKTKLLIVVAIVMVWISWSFGFKKTFHAISACEELESKAETAADLPAKEEALKKDLILLESKIGDDNDTLSFQQKMLKTISSFCDSAGLEIKEYPGADEKKETGYLIETHKLTIQGNFHGLVRLVQRLEHSTGIGKISSADFRKVKDIHTRKEELCLFLYINHILKVKSND